MSRLLARAVSAAQVAFALAACTTTRPAPMPAWPLLPPSAVEPRQVKQILHGAYGDKNVSLQCVVTVSPEALSVVGVTALGVRAFTVTYDGVRVTEQHSAQVPASFDPARLVDDIELVFWPLAALRDALTPLGWDVSEPFAGTRRVLRDGSLIAEVHYAGADPWSGRIWLVHFDGRYSLSIESSPLSP